MTRRNAFASLAILGTLMAMPALAQAPMDGGSLAPRGGNVIGGGGASLSGGADDMTITYSARGAGGGGSFEQTGRVGIFAGNTGGNPAFTFSTPAPSGPGREAWLMGGGEDSQVVYMNPTGRR
ncbi:hypothetical protein [Paracraurococcus lichenis]|uniref:Uncharacterized protein n=1 Tax=Paracraurococcus lichenis TaxID=3064888 RepID=A0ABT9DU64_9PROT|nr:hypothetical protein [Paracraurococcus sp. LOR1-02]MDO9707436.1 hypothetical protein [Paracraurococcus sp. LOR1-02]